MVHCSWLCLGNAVSRSSVTMVWLSKLSANLAEFQGSMFLHAAKCARPYLAVVVRWPMYKLAIYKLAEICNGKFYPGRQLDCKRRWWQVAQGCSDRAYLLTCRKQRRWLCTAGALMSLKARNT